ncbi:MAG TPA: hypothetical protein ACFYD1_06975 [Candidatus Hypogeohydataceae bacterium YC38]
MAHQFKRRLEGLKGIKNSREDVGRGLVPLRRAEAHKGPPYWLKGIKNSRAVLQRLKKGDIGAWAEIDMACLIKKAGHYVEFSSPKAQALNPDIIARIGGVRVNFETIYLQPPTGGRMQLTEVDRIKRAIDNKSRQLPMKERGVIVIYDQKVSVKDLRRLPKEAQGKLNKYPHIAAVIVVKEYARDGTPGVEEEDTHVLCKDTFDDKYRYTLIMKGSDASHSLIKTLKVIFCPSLS